MKALDQVLGCLSCWKALFATATSCAMILAKVLFRHLRGTNLACCRSSPFSNSACYREISCSCLPFAKLEIADLYLFPQDALARHEFEVHLPRGLTSFTPPHGCTGICFAPQRKAACSILQPSTWDAMPWKPHDPVSSFCCLGLVHTIACG